MPKKKAKPASDSKAPTGEDARATVPPPTPPGPASDKGGDGDEGSIVDHAWTVGFWTIASRLLGLYRFRLMAAIFGASGVADAFNFAFVFPNLTRRLFGEGLLSSVFVPVFSGMLAKGQKDAANRTASVLLCRLAYWLTAGCVGVMVLAGIARAVLPHVTFIEPRFELELKLFQWLLPYLIFINVAAVLMGILNSLKHFGVPAFAPVLLNVLMIAACFWVRYGPGASSAPEEQIWLVAYAVLAGGALQLLIQVPPAVARGFRFTPTMDAQDPGYREVVGNFAPVVGLVAIFQINVMLDNVIAQVFIPEAGPVTYLNMGTSVYQLAWSVFILALGTAALPELSRLWAEGKKDGFIRALRQVVRLSVYWAVPCTIGIMLLSEEIVRLLYGTGRFLEHDAEPVRRTAGVVMYSSLGLVFYSVNAMLARALYAMKDMRTPTLTSAKSVAINLALNLLFVVGLAHLARVLIPYRDGLASDQEFLRGGLSFVIALGSLKEAGIISNAWQTGMLVRALQRRLGDEGESTGRVTSGLSWFAGLGAASALIGYVAYRSFLSRPDMESFWAFFAAIFGSVGPFVLIGRQYFIRRLQDKPHEEDGSLANYGVKYEHWPDDLKFVYCFYATAVAATVMGFLVWAARDSLPPEGTLWPVVQRALVPVAAGVLVYSNASSSMMSLEYEELKQAFVGKLSRLARAFGRKA